MDEQQQSQRTNIALGLIIVMMVFFMWWSGGFSGQAPIIDGGTVALADGGTGPSAQTQVVMNTLGADGGETVAVAVPVGDGGTEAVLKAEAPPAPLVSIERKSDHTHFKFSSQGAGLESAELQGKKMREQVPYSVAEGFKRLFTGEEKVAPQMNAALPVRGSTLPLGLTVVSSTGATLVPGDLRYAVDSDQPESVRFKGTANGVEVLKTFEVDKTSFELRFVVELKNVGAQPLFGEYGVELSRAIDPRYEEAPSMFGGVGNQSKASCFVGDSYKTLLPKDESQTEEHKGAVGYVAIDQQYFLSAIFPLGAAKEGRCITVASPSVRRSVAYFALALQPGQAIKESFGVYIGPKDVDFLRVVPAHPGATAAGMTVFRPPLDKTIDFGIWAVLCNVLLWILKFFHGVFNNWGMAIIMLTVVVKLALVPLTHKSMVAAENMKKLQPKMEEIRKKYAEDRERQNIEMMKLYQEAKVNPVGGCLPLLLQMPVWIALFTTLRNSYDIYQAPFFAPFITDLTYKDPTYMLPLLLGVTMIITQKLQPQMMDATQAKIMTWVMPVVFTFMMLNYPAGLTLYIFTNNTLSILQQWLLKKWIVRTAVAKPA